MKNLFLNTTTNRIGLLSSATFFTSRQDAQKAIQGIEFVCMDFKNTEKEHRLEFRNYEIIEF